MNAADTFTPHREAPVEASKTGKKRLRRELFAKQNGLCIYCDEEMSLTGFNRYRIASFDHIRPLASGGPDTAANLVLACWDCNRLKGRLTPAQMRRLADRIERLQSAEQIRRDNQEGGERAKNGSPSSSHE